MENQEKIIAIILASGSGSRFGSDLPKQFCLMAGQPVLMRTINGFRSLLPDDNILVVLNAATESIWLELCGKYGFKSPHVTYGGDTRTKSLKNALDALETYDDNTVIMIHDGARPLLSAALIERMSSIPDGYVGAVPCVPVTDTLRKVDKVSGSHTVDRNCYVAVQTPQTFRLGTLRSAFRGYSGSGATDDATLVQNVTGGRIALIDGDTANIKVTNPNDIMIAEAILRKSEML